MVTDQRAHKTAESLMNAGYMFTLIGRKLPNSLAINRQYSTKRFTLLFTSGPAFYFEYNLRLFFHLLFCKADIFLSNDLDTLPANYLVSKIRKKPLVFDSHEYFTEVPELMGRPRKQRLWKRIEQFILPKLKNNYTVCNSIAKLYYEEYGVNFKVVRNIPVQQSKTDQATTPSDSLPKIIIYQGAVNMGRGLETAINAMPFVNNAVLWVVGDGDILAKLKSQVTSLKLQEKVKFHGRVPFNKLAAITEQATIGLSVEENIGLNYYYALPNKLFDYIHANIPVLGSNLPEISSLILTYDIGRIIKNHDPEHMAASLNEMLLDKVQQENWRINLRKAALELTWQNEEKVVRYVFNNLKS